MDVSEYENLVAPASNRSRLAPYWDDIAALRKKGYTLEQVRDFLKRNEVDISLQGLSSYIKRREAKQETHAAPAARKSTTAKAGSSDSPLARKIQNPGDLHEAMQQEVDLDKY